MYYIDNLEKQLDMAMTHYNCMLEGLKAYDRICQDYEHLIESYRYNAVQGAKILAGLREARVRRRFYKDNMQIMRSIIDNTKVCIRNVSSTQMRTVTRSGWKEHYNADIQNIINMKK